MKIKIKNKRILGGVLIVLLSMTLLISSCSKESDVIGVTEITDNNCSKIIMVVYWENGQLNNYSHEITSFDLFEGTLYLRYKNESVKAYYIINIKAVSMYE